MSLSIAAELCLQIPMLISTLENINLNSLLWISMIFIRIRLEIAFIKELREHKIYGCIAIRYYCIISIILGILGGILCYNT